jgi:hypothetical protein
MSCVCAQECIHVYIMRHNIHVYTMCYKCTTENTEIIAAEGHTRQTCP